MALRLLLLLALAAAAQHTRDECLASTESTCKNDGRPVCGSDGITYESSCEIRRAQCRSPDQSTPLLKHRGKCRGKQKCLTDLEYARTQSKGTAGDSVFMPSCRPDGTFAPVQCHKNTGFCWCVDADGRPMSNTVVKRNNSGKQRCVKQGKSATKRRSSTRGRGQKRACSLIDKAAFNSNLIDKFHTEWERIQGDNRSKDAELDRVVLEWKFKDMDKDMDGKLDKNEYRDLRKLVKKFVKPKRCSKSFARACDIDRDQHISRQEWTDCLTRDGMNDEKPSAVTADDDNGDADNSSSERDSEDAEDEDYDTPVIDFTHRRSPPHGILQNGGTLESGSQTSGEDSSDNLNEEATDCLSDRRAVLNEQRADKMYVPECTPDGRYKKIQCYRSVGYCWCVHEDTGKNIPGTSVQHATPKCDQVPASVRPMKGCPEPKKTVFLKDLMNFLHNRMITGTNDTNITGSEGGAWQASQEEKAATWNFVVLDKNKNKVLERKEWKAFRSLVSSTKQLRRCGKKLPRYCDVNNDRQISLAEWLDCLNTKRNIQGPTNPKAASQRIGKNPLHSFLKDD